MKFFRSSIRHHAGVLSMAFVAVFAGALYAYVLPLPFFRDDMVMLLWLRDMSWGRLWVDATGFPYYRPLSFSTLKLSELVFGWPEPISLHVLNLVLHAANSVMVALLTRRFFESKGKHVAAIFAGLLFAAYPFTYEVIPTTGPIFQLQAAFFGLASALCYANFKSQVANPKWLWASLALALLGAFTCEYGVIIPVFIVLVEAMLWWKGGITPLDTETREQSPLSPRGRGTRGEGQSKFSLIPLAYFIFSVLYLAIWVIVPKSRAEKPLILQGLGSALQDMPKTALYYLQGLTYPLQTLAWPLVRTTGMSHQLAVGLVAVVTLTAVVALFARARRLALLVFALMWFAVSLAPMWPTLNADYTLNGPRLHYLPSVGTTLIWGSLAAILFCHSERSEESPPRKNETLRSAQRDQVRQIVGALALVVTLTQSLVFLRGMADIITLGGRLTTDVSHTIAATLPDETALVVNFPSWIGKRETETTFSLGAEGISFLPGYSSMRDLVRLNTRQDRDVAEVTFTNTIQEWKYDQRLGLLVNWNKLVKAIRAAGHVWTIEYLPDTLRLNEAGSTEGVAAEPAAPEVTFDERIAIKPLSVTLSDKELRVEVAWTTVVTVDRQLTAFFHVYDAQGQLAAQRDGYPLSGLYPPWLTQKGETVHDKRHIPLPAYLPGGHYTMGVGMYDAETGQRVRALSPTGKRFENDVYLFYEFDVRLSHKYQMTPSTLDIWKR